MTTAEQQINRHAGRAAPVASGFTRYAIALAVSKGNRYAAAEYAAERWPAYPEVGMRLKAAVPAMGAADGPPPPDATDFLGLVRPREVVSRLNLRKVPSSTGRVLQTGGGVTTWLGERAPAPVGSLAFSRASLETTKCGGIIVLTEDLAKLSNPDAEVIIRDELVNGSVEFTDAAFLGDDAAVPGVSPAGMLAGVDATVSANDPVDDLRALLAGFKRLGRVAVVLSPANAIAMATAIPGGLAAISFEGGPRFVVSDAADDNLIAIDTARVLLAEGGISVEASQNATLEFDSEPDEFESIDGDTVMISLWQNGLLGLKLVRAINWLAAPGSVHAVSGAEYTT